jgi:cytoskeletal protein CcmA (bactofilin family)
MWNKSEAGKTQSAAGSVPPRPPATQSAGSGAPAAAMDGSSSVSQGIRIKGEVSGQGDLYWDGGLEGTIQIEDGSFTVGPNGRVTADINAREIIVHGEVIGTLHSERVQVSSTGRVTGDMETRGIVIEDGAILRSKVQVRQEDKSPQTAKEAVRPRAKEAAAAAGAAGTQSKEPGA